MNLCDKKVVFIDWYNTLSTDVFWQQWSEAGHENNDIFQAINRLLFEGGSGLIMSWMRGELSAEEICERISKSLSVDKNIIFDGLKTSALRMGFADLDLSTLVNELRKKNVRVVLATDNMDTFSRFTVPALNLDSYFDDILDSFRMQTLKGENDGLDFFGPYLEQAGCDWSDAVLVDDCAQEFDVLSDRGFECISVKNPKETLTVLQYLTAG